MIKITNDKLVSLDPIWAKFVGFSLLYDNPGDNIHTKNNIRILKNIITSNNELSLYHAFIESINNIGDNILKEEHLLCLLPPSSYHVTLWNGVNNANIMTVIPKYRPRLQKLLKSFPISFYTIDQLSLAIKEFIDKISYPWTISYKFNDLQIWRNKVLVARLKLVECHPNYFFEKCEEEKKILSKKFQDLLNIKISQNDCPHITIGYYANDDYAKNSMKHVRVWNEVFETLSESYTITFNKIHLYGFTDMETFFQIYP